MFFAHREAAAVLSTAFDYEAFFARTQQTLIEFLDAELRVGPRFAEAASQAKSSGDMAHYIRAKYNAVKAAEFIQRFVSRVSDETVRNEIRLNLAELHRLISRL
jgi:hypothetical protein